MRVFGKLAATMVFLLCTVFAGAGSKNKDDNVSGDTFKDCLERSGDTACRPMRDEGNMNNACAQAVADCNEKTADDEAEEDD